MTIVIPSRDGNNLNLCVQSLLRTHEDLDLNQILCIDDGVTGCEYPIRFIPGIKPFVYARNVNLGLQGDDILLMGDDVEFCTPNGITQLASHGTLVSPMVVGNIGNQRQGQLIRGQVIEEPDALCFVCVYLPRKLIQDVGLLDERFVGYGFEDTDYSLRARQRGWKLMVDGRVEVHHDLLQNSSFRRQKNYGLLHSQNRFLFVEKWPEQSLLEAESSPPEFF